MLILLFYNLLLSILTVLLIKVCNFILEYRYGDELNPWGDIITMGRVWCQMKPGARALVGFPAGKDTICFNAAKFYGSFLLPHVFANWKQVYSEGFMNPREPGIYLTPYEIVNWHVNCKTDHVNQPIHVLER